MVNKNKKSMSINIENIERWLTGLISKNKKKYIPMPLYDSNLITTNIIWI